MKMIGPLIVLIMNMSFCASKEQTGKIDPISKILLRRYSGYSFDPERFVTHDQLQSIVKAGQLAPSSFNDQPWYFIICDHMVHPDAYNKVFSTLVEFNQKWAKNAPILIVSIVAINSHNNEFNRWAQYDTGAAAFSMMLQATSLGLMAHQMGGFDEIKLKEIFTIPDNFIPMSVMAIGYAAINETKSIKKERKPLSENFFMGSWGLSKNDVWQN